MPETGKNKRLSAWGPGALALACRVGLESIWRPEVALGLSLGPLNIGVYGGIWGLYRDNGKENGSYYLGFRVVLNRSLGLHVYE